MCALRSASARGSCSCLALQSEIIGKYANVIEAVRKAKSNRLNSLRRASSDGWRMELVKAEKATTGIIAAIEDSLYQPSMKSRMEELERRKADLTARLAEASGKGPDILPNGCGVYRGREDYLRPGLIEAKSTQLCTATCAPSWAGSKRKPREGSKARHPCATGVSVSMVAGVRNHLKLLREASV
jgi:hypothetical protein